MTKSPMKNITHTDRLMMISALRAGVVPRVGLQHIQVGRSAELEAIIGDIECIADGKAAFRIIAGDYGSGKTFFLSLLRNIAFRSVWLCARLTFRRNAAFTVRMDTPGRCTWSCSATHRCGVLRAETPWA